MKKLRLMLASILLAGSSFAQSQYVVNICVTASNPNSGATANYSLNWWTSAQSGQYSGTAGPNSPSCVVDTIIPDSANMALLSYAVYNTSCNPTTGDTSYYHVITSDTTLYITLPDCGNVTTPACGATIIEDSLSTFGGLIANGTGTPPFNYLWSTGEATQSIYFTPGQQYCLTVTDATGCVAYDCFGGNNNGCSVAVYQDSTGGGSAMLSAYPQGTAPFTYAWSNGAATQNIYVQSAGQYCVTVTDANGCTSQSCFTYNPANSNCSVNFYAIADSTQPGLVTFVANGNGISPFSYTWDFGDNTSGTGQTVTHMYQNNSGTNGVYVCVFISDSAACSNSFCDAVYFGGGNQPTCSVVFYSDSANTAAGAVQFYSYPNGQAPFTYSWSFSNGTTSAQANPSIALNPGNSWPWACLEVTDANGCVSSYCDYVNVTPSPAACYASFGGYFDNNTNSANPGEVFFYDYSTTGGTAVSWAWDFGDGTGSTLQNPSHVYTTAGYYTICLTVTDATGCTSTSCQTCYIDPTWWTNSPWNPTTGQCDANFIALQDSSIGGGLIYLVDLSYGNNLYYTWTFAGTVVNTQYPFVTFNSFGTTNICLTITDTITGCSDTYCDSVVVDSLGNLTGKAGNWAISVIPSPMPQTQVGIRTQLIRSGLTLYPNPVTEVLTIESVSGFGLIEVSDIAGSVVLAGSTHIGGRKELNVSELPDGVYSIRIITGDQISTSKFVKIK